MGNSYTITKNVEDFSIIEDKNSFQNVEDLKE